MSHTEGGWPKDVDSTEAEHVIRYRRKIEKDDDYVRSIVSLGYQARALLERR
jgi:dynein intermediate chain 2